MIILKEPSYAIIDGDYDERILKAHLEYVDKKVDYDIKRLKDSAHWYAGDEEKEAAYQEQLSLLKEQRRKIALFVKDGVKTTYSGLAYPLAEQLQTQVRVEYELPPPKALPYTNKPKYEPRYYQ